MINIDFLLAGCNTHCKHCYVNGGPGPLMPIDDVLKCIEKLDALAALLPSEVTFTLDHEPMNHPHIDKILRAASKTCNAKNYHHGMTTGVGLMSRRDKHAVLRAYLDCGYRDFGITIHGNAPHHDEITRRKGAFSAAVSVAEFIKSEVAELSISLMLNCFFVEDAPDISAILKRLRPDYIYFAIPIYTPHCNMTAFEPYRATIDQLEQLHDYLAAWGKNAADLIGGARKSTVSAAIERLRDGTNLLDLFAKKQDELYLSLHQDCSLYVGNSGAETKCLGDIINLDLNYTANILASLPGNRDYGAFYDVKALPDTNCLTDALTALPQNAVYGDFSSVIYRGLDELNITTLILE